MSQTKSERIKELKEKLDNQEKDIETLRQE